ncbi:MAG: DGQHR domain-containing protein [bacterium]
MSEAPLAPMISGDEVKAELRKRRSPYNFKTVTSSKPALLKDKVKLEEADGWIIYRENKHSYRMKQDKPLDEQLEDKLWCILAQMGFKELSKGRQFCISVGDGLPARQIDVFAKDDETALIVECTQRETPGKKPMASLIEKIKAIREPVLKSVDKHYGRKEKPKVKFVIATRNIAWADVDLRKCEDAKIAVVTDNEIDYYNALVRHLKHAARYQLLGHMFGGTGIKGLAHDVVATRGKMGDETFYTFLIRPEELLKIAYVGHKASRDIENLATYQRMLQPTRLKKIAKFINDGGKFPTNIVVNLNTTKRKGLKFEEKEKVGQESLGVLHLPANYAAAWIIDGQHRLYGYAYARQDEGYNNDKTTLQVLAFENLPADKEMNLFIDINSKQVKVAPGLLSELYSDLHWNSSDPEKAFQALLSRVASRLNSEKTSPLNERMVVTGKKKTSYRCLTQTSIRDGLEKAKLLGTFAKSSSSIVPGPFSTADPLKYSDNLKKSLSILSECIRLFAKAMPEHWELGDGQGGYLCTNIGLRALFHVLKDLSDYATLTTGADLRVMTAEDAFESIRHPLLVLVEYFKGASSQEILAFRQIGSSLSLVQQQSRGMEAQIHKNIENFFPALLKDYLDSRDEQGTEEAGIKVRKINKRLFDYVIGRLKEVFGEDSWWIEGVPLTIRHNCVNERETNKRAGKKEEYLYLRNYVDISIANWEIMKDVISLDAKDKSAKKKNVRWINELNEISKKTKHPEKGPLSTEQVARVNELYEMVEHYFPSEDDTFVS